MEEAKKIELKLKRVEIGLKLIEALKEADQIGEMECRDMLNDLAADFCSINLKGL